MAARLNRGDVHLCNFALPDKQRPVLILTRDSAVGHPSSVTVAAISSTRRDVPSEVILGISDGMKGPLPSICTTPSPFRRTDWAGGWPA